MRLFYKWLRQCLWGIRYYWYRYCLGVDVDRTVRIGAGVVFDRTYPKGIHIGNNTYITNKVTILTHDHVRSVWRQNTYIGARCFIGNQAIIMPGLSIGDEVVVGAGSVITRNVPPNCIVAGNPAKIIRQGIRMSTDARLVHEL